MLAWGEKNREREQNPPLPFYSRAIFGAFAKKCRLIAPEIDRSVFHHSFRKRFFVKRWFPHQCRRMEPEMQGPGPYGSRCRPAARAGCGNPGMTCLASHESFSKRMKIHRVNQLQDSGSET
jgi:hypothetical protein